MRLGFVLLVGAFGVPTLTADLVLEDQVSGYDFGLGSHTKIILRETQ